MDKNNNNQEPNKIQYMPIGMCIGIGVGMAIGSALGNIPIGMCMGLSIGLGLGAMIDSLHNKKDHNDSKSDENEKQ